MRSTISMSFDKHDDKAFSATCEAAIQNVFKGTKKATEKACQEILASSLSEVPRETTTLADSAFYEVSRRSDTAKTTWSYKGIVGYGGNGDPVNPKTGEPASRYMVAVHERLDVEHPIGKAKFLEDPVSNYGNSNFARHIVDYAKAALSSFLRR